MLISLSVPTAREQRSKKHVKAVQQLKKQMLAEDAEFSLQAQPVQTVSASEDEMDEPPVASTSRSPSPANAPASAQPDSDSDSDSNEPQRQTQSSKKTRKKAKREEQEQKKLAQQMQESTLAESEAAAGGEEQMSKKDKRRAREKAKAESAKENEKQVCWSPVSACIESVADGRLLEQKCNVCGVRPVTWPPDKSIC